MFESFYIVNAYGLIRNKTNFMGAILLKWLKEKKIALEKRKSGILNKEETCVILYPDNIDSYIEFENIYESDLYDMLMNASKDGVLEKRELKKWCSNKHYLILKWFDNVINEEKKQLIYENKIEVIEKKKIIKYKTYKLSNYLLTEAIKLSGLKKFLKDYSLIHEREAIEVALFEDYLIYAQILGIADKVKKQFKELYPDIIENSNFNSFDDIDFIMTCAASGISRANSARAAAETYSAGGGGFSSGGGGGGSFGGGGGRRRFPLIFKIDSNSFIINRQNDFCI